MRHLAPFRDSNGRLKWGCYRQRFHFCEFKCAAVHVRANKGETLVKK